MAFATYFGGVHLLRSFQRWEGRGWTYLAWVLGYWFSSPRTYCPTLGKSSVLDTEALPVGPLTFSGFCIPTGTGPERLQGELTIMVSAVRFCPSAPLLFCVISALRQGGRSRLRGPEA